jgi:CubicO group peptidase (beta-lactamase class C family)
MKARHLIPLALALAGWSTTLEASPPLSPIRSNAPSANALTDAEIQTMLRDWIDVDKLEVGMVVGIVDPQGARVIAHGKADNGTQAEVDGDTVFCLGSITKVFTSLLLQDMVERGEMKLNDPVQQYLPASCKMPTYQGKQITLLHLATHTSGLPRDCQEKQEEFLARCKLARAPGMKWDYSNFGLSLLAEAIARKAGKDYEELVMERICRPLGMENTRIKLTPELKKRLATGHAMPLHRLPDPGPGAGGVGGLRSTAHDMLKFIAAYAGITPSPLSSLMEKAQAFHGLESGEQRRLAWFGSGPVCEHGGWIGGYQAEMAFDREKRRGVVILANCVYCGTLLPAIWEPLIRGQSPRPQWVAPVEGAARRRYVGQYQLEKGTDLCVVRERGERFMYQGITRPAEQPRYGSVEAFPGSDSVFQNEFFGSKVEFHVSGGGEGVELVLSRLHPEPGDKPLKFRRISRIAPEMAEPVVVDPKVYDGYVGQYRKALLFGLFHIGPTLSISHRTDELGHHLIGYVREYGRAELFPKSETEFVPEPPDNEPCLTFVRNRKGKASSVIVRTGGRKVRGARISDEPAK